MVGMAGITGIVMRYTGMIGMTMIIKTGSLKREN